MIKPKYIFTPVFLAWILCISAGSSAQIQLSKVARTVDLSSHLPQMTAVVTAENKGSSPVHSLQYAIESNLLSKLTFISANVRFLALFT